jgi:uncharacterized repeat protein (TIGR01451 family)
MTKLRTLFMAVVLVSAAALPASAQSSAVAPGTADAAAAVEPLVLTAANRTAAAEAANGAPRASGLAKPGDEIAYRLAFTNTAGRPVRGVTFTNALPAGALFVGGSVRSSRTDLTVEYSADGGETFSAQPMEEVLIDGRRVRRPVDAARYTDIRWSVAGWVAPDALITTEYHTRLAPAVPAAAADVAPNVTPRTAPRGR